MSERNDVSCKATLQPTLKKEYKSKGSWPAMRINKSKGIEYVQVKGYYGNTWLTVGKASPENLGYARRIVEDLCSSRIRDTAKELGTNHGLLDTKEKRDAYDNTSENHGLRWNMTDEDYKIEEELDNIKEKMYKQYRENFHRKVLREQRRNKQAMRKLQKNLQLPKPKKEEIPKDLLEKALKEHRTIVYETDGKRFQNFRLGDKKEDEKE
jgi:hypothetical protein